jgi:phosphohistidine phosphatase
MPTRALCSPALRASATLEAARAALAGLAQVEFVAALYLASAGELLRALQRVPDAELCVLVVAHEPGLSECVRVLAGRASATARASLARGMPPASFAALALEIARWEDAGPACGELLTLERRDVP